MLKRNSTRRTIILGFLLGCAFLAVLSVPAPSYEKTCEDISCFNGGCMADVISWQGCTLTCTTGGSTLMVACDIVP